MRKNFKVVDKLSVNKIKRAIQLSDGMGLDRLKIGTKRKRCTL